LPRRGRAAGGNAKKTRKKRRLKKEAAPVQEKAAVISLAIFGAGNLGSAIVQGIASSGKLNMKNIAIYDKVLTRAKAAAKGCKARVAESVRDALDGCEAVILAVKPQNMPEVLEEVRANLTYTSPLIISTAAGWPISQIELLVGKDFPIARIMPNINAAVGQSATVFSVNGAVTEEQSEKLCKILTAFGTASLVEESHFAAHLALSGAGPAFAYLFADALARAGVRLGLPREEALTAAIQTLLGSAENLKASGIHPQELVDRVCSPGGITIEGVLALEETGFAASVAGAVSAAFEKNLAL
ncbi:MAG: pyrroline-5-carboxylate reductase, partial [Oscillospiraceae bacterium]|nr:pyrroline-5-carboxylate reductase [Oscillospiraceae bacterium]